MKIFNEPEFINFSEYEEQIEKYKNRVKNIPGVNAIYLMGSIKAPGLSDIDIIVVVDDDFDAKLSCNFNVVGLDQRLFMHGPIIVPLSLASSIQEIFYASNLKCIFGKQCLQEWESLSSKKRKLLSVCYLLDFIESRFLQVASLEDGPIDKRAWLTRIWSTVHSLFLYRVVTGGEVNNEILELEEVIKITRNSWLKNYVVEDDVFINGLEASSKINKFIFDEVLKEYYGCPILQSSHMIKGKSKCITFDNCYLKPEYKVKSLSIFSKSISVVNAYQCPRYLAHLQGYFLLKPNWEVKPIINKEFEEIKSQRSDLVIQHAEWLIEHAPGSKSMKGYLGLDTTRGKGIKDSVKKLLTRLIF